MKKIQSGTRCGHYPSANIYREDIVKIIDIFEEVCDKLEIYDDEYQYDSLEELQQKRGIRPKKISIFGRNPYVSIDLKQNKLWLYRATSDQKSVYAYKSIEDILIKKRNLVSILFNKTVGILSSVILFIFLIVQPVETIKNWFPNLIHMSIFLLILIGTPTIYFFNNWGVFSYITLKNSHEELNFFERNKDDILKIVIGAVIGAVVTWSLTKFFGK